MYSKENDRNINICKIHHKRKVDEKIKNDTNRNGNIYRLEKLAIGSIISIMILFVPIAVAVTETGSWDFGAVLSLPPKEILNNVWGAPSSERQSGSLSSYIYYKSNGNFGWEWHRNNPIAMNGWIQPIFPEAMLDSDSGFLPIKLKNINSLSSVLQYQYPTQPTGGYNLAYDVWFTSGTTRKAEIMFWVSCTAECTPGTNGGEINDGYNTYKVYYTEPSSWRPWLYYAFILKNQNPVPFNHTVDMKVLLNSISNRLDGEWDLSRLDLGNEVWDGSGRIEISKWQLNLNSPVVTPTPTSTPSPTPTVTPTPSPTPTVTPTPVPVSTETITVTSPNGGENWKKGTIKTISWSSSGNLGSYVKIELLKGGTVNKVISSYTRNDGSYSWIVPHTQIVGTDYKVRITSKSNSAYKDDSDKSFSIYQQ